MTLLFLYIFIIIPIIQVVYTVNALIKNRGIRSRKLLYSNIATTLELIVFTVSQTSLITDGGPVFIYVLVANIFGVISLRRTREYLDKTIDNEDSSIVYLLWSVVLTLSLIAWIVYMLIYIFIL